MNKHFTSLLTVVLLLAVTMVHAQTFEFQYQGQSVAEGATVTIPAVVDPVFEELSCASNPSDNPTNGLLLHLLSGTEATGSATLTITHNTLDAQLLKWCMGGECTLMTSQTQLTKDFTVTNGNTQVQFDAENIKSQGYLLATLTATIGTETHTIQIQFTNGQSAPEPFWWGYFSDANAASLPYSGNLGSGSAATIDAAIYVPAGHPIVGNGTLKGIRFWLGSTITAISGDVTLWISKTLPTSASAADYTQTLARTDLKAKLNEVELTTPYTVNNEGFYVGYTFKISSRAYPVMSYGEDQANAFFYRITGYNWMDFYGEGYGALAMQLLIDGVTLPEYSVTPADFPTNYALTDNIINVPVQISNNGTEAVTSISYVITTDGVAGEEQTKTVSNLKTFAKANVSISFTAGQEAKKYQNTVTITKVNGQPNAAASNSASGSLIAVSEKPVAVPVVEEFTGTWCGYCPYGIVGMEQAHKTFGDKVVLIAAHNGDPMAITDYNPIMSSVSSFPSAFINRISDLYPSVSSLKTYIQSHLDRTTVGSITATASWSNAAKTAIDIDTQTTFVYNDDNGQYAIAYVLIEDGLKGTSSSWAQTNYLSGQSATDPNMTFWYNAGSKVTGLEFDHVAVAAWNIADGVEGSVNNSFQAGQAQNYHFQADISNKSVIQDKTKLTVASLLLDKSTGSIVNAAQCTIQDYASGIRTVTGTAASSQADGAYYTLDGRRVTTPARGLYIHNGRKVVIK